MFTALSSLSPNCRVLARKTSKNNAEVWLPAVVQDADAKEVRVLFNGAKNKKRLRTEDVVLPCDAARVVLDPLPSEANDIINGLAESVKIHDDVVCGFDKGGFLAEVIENSFSTLTAVRGGNGGYIRLTVPLPKLINERVGAFEIL